MLRLLPAILLLALPSFVHADQPRVVTTIKPIQQIAAAVLDGVASADVLLPAGASPHAYALRPSDRRSLMAADRIYWVGPDLELFLQSLLAEEGGAKALMDIDGLQQRTYPERHNFQQGNGRPDSHAGHDHGHKHDHAAHKHDEHHGHSDHQEHADHGHDDHDHGPGTLDAHIWLSPDNARVIARYMATDLGELFPEYAEQIAANQAAFDAAIDGLDKQLSERFAPLQDKGYFVFHDAYGYFEDHYGLRSLGVFTVSHEVQPGARQVNMLREQLRSSGRVCVFTEPQFTPRLVQSLTRDLPVEHGELDPLGAGIEVGPHGYATTIQQLADNLAGCLEQL
ncbi:MAG: zinc ABC transporter substrate-binding protein ZnuA [Gammaproteobacteria bacterium]|nr:zinc ABC transporter substrate-binding protein ZnuA [Gammaproteobacteria bacterium]